MDVNKDGAVISSEQTDALVALEDSAPDVLFETFPGTDLALWPLLRYLLVQSMGEITNYNAAASAETVIPTKNARPSLRTLAWRAANLAIPNAYSPRRIGRRDLLFVVRGTTLAQTASGRKNWYIGDYAAGEPDRSAILQDRGIKRRGTALERPSFGATFTFDRDIYLAKRESDRHPVSDADATRVRTLVREIYRALPYAVPEERIDRAIERVIERGQYGPHVARRFARLIDRVKPRIAFFQTAAYFNHASLLPVLKDRGVLLVEPQHGWIGPSHPAYNFGAAFTRPELARYMPDVLLTFGEFWSDAVRMPSEKVAIGKAHLEGSVSGAQSLIDREKTVLVVAGVYQEEVLTRYAKQIRDRLPGDWRVLFRPHPSERAVVAQRYPGLMGEDRIEIDKTLDVNESLGNARAVFGFASTVLYEAMGFGCDVFVFDSPLADQYVDREIFGDRLTDEASVRAAVAKVLDPTAPRARDKSGVLDSIWRPDAIENFREFVRDRIGSEA